MQSKNSFGDRAGGRSGRAMAVARTALAVAFFGMLGAAGAGLAQDGGSGVQVTPDAERVLVNKDVGGERWAITRNNDDTVTGNVFLLDGSPPAFVWCEPLDDDDDFFDFIDDLIDDLIDDDDDGDGDDQLSFACYGADRCLDTPCSDDEWSFIADVTLPESFFRP